MTAGALLLLGCTWLVSAGLVLGLAVFGIARRGAQHDRLDPDPTPGSRQTLKSLLPLDPTRRGGDRWAAEGAALPRRFARARGSAAELA